MFGTTLEGGTVLFESTRVANTKALDDIVPEKPRALVLATLTIFPPG